MSDKMREGNDPNWRRALRVGAVIVGLIGVAGGPLLLYFVPTPHVGWATIIAGLIFMVSSRFDDVVEIGFGSFKTRLERRVQDVEMAMEAVRRLAKASARSALNSVQNTGRMGALPEKEKLEFLNDTRRLLRDLGVDAEEARELEQDWHRVVEFDYGQWVLGGPTRPDDVPLSMTAKWGALHAGGVSNRPSLKALRAFLEEANMLTPDREEVLQDYAHYVATGEHRRIDAWLKSQERYNV